MVAITIYTAMQMSQVRVLSPRHRINFECLRIFNTNNLVNSKICITFALENERQGVLNNQNDCKFFQRGH